MNSLLIKNVRAVLPSSVTEPCDILVENGKIAEIGCTKAPEGIEVLDGNGGLLTPGFVDVHVHGGGGADFMDAACEDFEIALKAHLKHGTTTLLPTAMTATEEDLIAFVKAFLEYRKNPAPNAAKAPGVHLEGPYFSGATGKSKGAQPGNLLRMPDKAEMERIIAAAEGSVLRWDAAPELEGSDMFARVCLENGIMPAIAHTAATSEQALEGIKNGFAHVTHFYNACTTYRKEGQKVLAGAVEAAYLSDNVTVELIGDGCHIPRDILRVALKFKGADKVCVITDATRISCTDLKKGMLGSRKNGTEVIVDDGVAKLLDMSCFAGSIATADRCFRVLVKDYGIDTVTACRIMSQTPAEITGLSDVGSIEKGKCADLVLFDEELNIKSVVLNGAII